MNTQQGPDRSQARMTMQTLRTANVFDGMGADGKPLVDRKPLDRVEAVHVLAYPESAPVVQAAAEPGSGQVDGTRGRQVPLIWQTDGDWVWPGSVPYYLRTYALPPDPVFVDHIRQRRYQPRPSTRPNAGRAGRHFRR
jgi:hypothetical protein